MTQKPDPVPFDAFERQRVDCGDVTLDLRRAGEGPPLVLLHGYPQTGDAWAAVAPALTPRFDVLVPDLRGYGQSDAPPDDADHTVYSKRRMAEDIVAMLDKLGLDAAHVMGHDRGARVAYRMALDHPDRVTRVAVLEIVPTGTFWSMWNADIAQAAYHWTFLAQPAPLPERMIGADPEGYCDWTLASWSATRDLAPFPQAALAAYRAQMADPARCAAMCADYRAGATTDRRIDDESRARDARIAAPLLLLHGDSGFPARTGDPAGLWRDWARDITTRSYTGGHFAMEEAPDDVIAAALDFFGQAG